MKNLGSKPIPELTESDITRFWSHVQVGRSDDCWPWMGGTVKGYGQFKVQGRMLKAHRVAFLIANGLDPVGLMVRHTCDNPPCCNGGHLIKGTGADNQADCIARGRNNPASGERHGSRTHPESRTRGEHSNRAILTTDQVVEIRAMYALGGITQLELANMFSVKRETIGGILRGDRWGHVPVDRSAVNVVSLRNKGKLGESHRDAKLTEADVLEIRRRYSAKESSYSQLATEYGISKGAIAFIVRRVSWKHLP